MGPTERSSQWTEHGNRLSLRSLNCLIIIIQLRVWGGGIYQPSDEETGVYNFYEMCDELGILAWSELIFSDNIYPINDFMLDNIAPEVRQNVRRTNRHPSNAQWAGGNEIEGIVEQVNVSIANGTHYLNEVGRLYF